MAKIPRPEYPRPQFVREDWLNLNGDWQFEIDTGDSGLARGLLNRELSGKIRVPFCPECKLSGVEYLDFMEAVWYRREVTVPESWGDRRVQLNFQAVDYEATVWVNGREVGRHRGGYSPFSCDLGFGRDLGGKATIVVRARDPRDWAKPCGKQSMIYENYGCHYPRTTGIWQTVWMEPVAPTSLKRPRITPCLQEKQFRIDQHLVNPQAGWKIVAVLKDSHGDVSRAEVVTGGDFASTLILPVPADRLRLWQPGDGQLYDIDLSLFAPGGELVDHATSYAGMRSVSIDGLKVKINGKTVFQRQVLDQGYYPDGLLTAPTDEALMRDITLAMRAGFNAARLHQKVFEERFLYHADSLGYLVWGEYGDWGYRQGTRVPSTVVDGYRHQPAAAMMTQWLEVLERDYSHPAIIGWCPLNETSQSIEDYMTTLDDVTRGMFLAAKLVDNTRPVLDSSGYSHRVAEADIYDCHDYSQDPAKFAVQQSGLAADDPFQNGRDKHWSIPYRGQPYFVSEFGGIWWNPKAGEKDFSWGYGERPKSLDEFYTRFKGLCDVLLDNPKMFGYCYTQLTDVFQEQNGVLFFDRSMKFDLAKLHAVQSRKAAIETLEA
ncbi:glycoside hydrolase family 2 protein [Oligosphaera ethanolica]|uniref:Beta-galactosidase/beta-glucuronidase n=1 Tax=Oligosphaera ethanolica TaxID=760260 RepID=A0AAE3VFU0_9BACT|nr:sugar-binding domain-containing protein [Oligosphaera ethanolica]MDQ0289621.1 beta-galactosidase/beta-glucuronidase [Oligosphaera ethanolica]